MDEIERFSHIARIRLVEGTDLLALAKERGKVDGEDGDIFTFRAEISNDLLDAHFTHMATSTLTNYAADAEAGVAFLRGHDRHSLPIGYSVEGRLEQDGSKQRVLAGFYTVRGLAETDDLIFRMQKGLVRDVSVGFYGGRMVCDICGADFWDCRHYPGLKFEEKKGDTVTTQLSTFTVEDARLSEVSGVFDGSTPDAGIIKAQRAAKSGELTKEQIVLLEQRYRIHLPVSTIRASVDFASLDYTKGGKKMEEETKDVVLTAKQYQRLVDSLAIRGILPEEERKTVQPDAAIAFVQLACDRIKDLEPQAADGRQYRTDLVAEAVAEGVRALGNDFDKDSYESILKSAPLKTIQRMRDDWKKTADAGLPAGRRTTETENRAPQRKNGYVPDSAFM